jgi:cyanophycin synthetase
VIVQNVAPNGYAVLNAADPMVARMADSCPGGVIFFALSKDHPIIAAHRVLGKRAVYVEDGALVAIEGEFEQRVPLKDIPLTRNGSIGFQVENAMAATAAAWGLGLDWAIIRQALGSFVNDAATAPGRFNVFDYRGATLIADYGHNPDAIIALVNAIENMPARRRVVVISGAGDRRDEDIRQQTQILGDAFDSVVLYQDQCQRGRADGEVISLLREGLVNARRATDVTAIDGEFNAIDAGLSRLEPGDLCLILIDQVDEALAYIKGKVAN